MPVVNSCAQGDRRKLGQNGKGGISRPEQSTPRGDSIPSPDLSTRQKAEFHTQVISSETSTKKKEGEQGNNMKHCELQKIAQ